MSEKIKLAALLSRDRLPVESGGTVYLLLQLVAPERRGIETGTQGPEAGVPGEGAGGRSEEASGRLPLNLSAVLDRSGSMEGAKLEYTKKALAFLIDQVGSEDFLSIVTYDDEVGVLRPAAHISNKDLLKGQVSGIRTGGATNLSGGLAAGVREARKNAGKGMVNRVLLMTDGLANRGVTDRDALVHKARQIRQNGLLLTTMGVGDDFDEDLLTAMAEAGGGNFYYIENPDKIPSIFSQELQGLLAVAGQGLGIRVKAGEGVSINGVLGYQPSGTPAEIAMDLPDIYAGETKSLVLELQVNPGPQGSRKLAEVKVEYEDLLGNQGEVEILLELSVSLEPGDSLRDVRENPDVLREVYMIRSAEAVEEAIRRADRGDFSGGSQILEDALCYLEPLADYAGADDAAVSEQARALREKAEQLRSADYGASTRKQMRTMSFQTRSGRRQN